MESEAQLSALRRATSMGSKLMVAGATTAISSALVSWLTQAGFDPDSIEVSGISLPAPIAIAAFAVTSVASGWAGWAYLRQAQKLLYRLEFEIGVTPDQIRASLTGSSLASASTLLLKVLCCLALLSLVASLPNISVFTFVTLLIGVALHLPHYLLISSPLLLMPYLVVIFAMPRLRYLNPDNWESGRSFFSLIFSGATQEWAAALVYKISSSNLALPEGGASFDSTALSEEFQRSLPQILMVTRHTLERKFGIGVLWRYGRLEELFFKEFMVSAMRRVDRILALQLPDLGPEARKKLSTELRDYLATEMK